MNVRIFTRPEHLRGRVLEEVVRVSVRHTNLKKVLKETYKPAESLSYHCGSLDWGSPDQGSPEQGSPDRGSPDRGSPDWVPDWFPNLCTANIEHKLTLKLLPP